MDVKEEDDFDNRISEKKTKFTKTSNHFACGCVGGGRGSFFFYHFFKTIFLTVCFCEAGPPKYMIGRATTEAELERDLATKPFETYDLFRGQKFGGNGDAGDYRTVGKFKVLQCVRRLTLLYIATCTTLKMAGGDGTVLLMLNFHNMMWILLWLFLCSSPW